MTASETPPMPAAKIAYPFEEGMQLIGLSRRSGYRAWRDNKIETYTVGKRRYVTHAALCTFLAELQKASNEAGANAIPPSPNRRAPRRAAVGGAA